MRSHIRAAYAAFGLTRIIKIIIEMKIPKLHAVFSPSEDCQYQCVSVYLRSYKRLDLREESARVEEKEVCNKVW